MDSFTTVVEKLKAMCADYDNRVQDASDRIIALGNELQQEKDAMAVAATEDNMEEYRAHEARMRFLNARIDAAKREQVEPMFSSLEEARQIQKEYDNAFNADVRPIYVRFLDLLNEQAALLEELMKLETAGHSAAFRISPHTIKVGLCFSEAHAPRNLTKFPITSTAEMLTSILDK